MRKRRDTVPLPERVCAVIPAAGSSRRMGENKLLLELGGVPVLVRTVTVFQQCREIDEVILVCREQDIVPYGRLMSAYGLTKVTQVLRGGETRAASVLAGVCACGEDVGWVAVHDGARPFLSQALLHTVLAEAKAAGAAAPVVPIKDSIKRVSNGFIEADVPRETLQAVQTPQIFRRQQLREALHTVLREGRVVTDDCAAAERCGIRVRAVTGNYDNLKITTPEDLSAGEAILERQAL